MHGLGYILSGDAKYDRQQVNSSGTQRQSRASLLLAGLTVTVPFLIPYHNYPLLTFYGEWTALFLGVLTIASLLLLRKTSPPLLPWVALGLIGFCVVLFLQMASGSVAYPQRSITGVMYALWAAVLAWSGVALRQRYGEERAFTVLAGFLAGGALLLVVTGFMQYFRIETIFGKILETTSQVGMYGILAQRNLFANYVACGLAATGFLYARGSLGVLTSLLLSVPMAAALAYSGSRTAWVYFAILLVVLACCIVRTRERYYLRGMGLIIAAGICFMLIRIGPAGDAVPRAENMAPWEWMPYRSDDFTQVPIAPRLFLAWHALIQFLGHPFLGAGYGEFGWNMFQNAPLLDGHMTPGIDRHAHNIVLQLLAETGLAGFLLVGGGVAAWVWGIRGRRLSHAEVWMLVVLLIQLAHSLVEFPLWYAQFLGLTMLLIGLTSEKGIAFGRSIIGRGLSWSIVVVGLVILALYFRGYRDYERWYLTTVSAEAQGKFAPIQHINELLELKHAWMFAPYFDLLGAEIIAVDHESLDTKLMLNAHALRLFPIPSAVSRQALLLALADRDDEAWEFWRRLRIVYPLYESTARQSLSKLAREHPAIARLEARLRATGGKL